MKSHSFSVFFRDIFAPGAIFTEIERDVFHGSIVHTLENVLLKELYSTVRAASPTPPLLLSPPNFNGF